MAVVTMSGNRGRDASDCRALCGAGVIRLARVDPATGRVDFGVDARDSIAPLDGECDDPRFDGPGAVPDSLGFLVMRDAGDCRSLYDAGRVWLSTGPARR